MKITKTDIEGVLVIELDVFEDERGFFVEKFNVEKLKDSGIPTKFFQDNHSLSKPNVLRGLHFQTDPAQGKLVGVATGKIWDVAVDIRPDSPTFGQYVTEELDYSKLLWVPQGFAHGFVVVGDEPANVLYKVSHEYSPESEGGIKWDDPELAIKWPISGQPSVSEKDEKLNSFAEYKSNMPE